MAYATVYQVVARTAARITYTATSIPNATQVVEFILESAAQLDQWLLAGGYDAPFDSKIASGLVATNGQMLLQRWNVTGAALYVEEAAQQPINLKALQEDWKEIKSVILDKTIDVPLPMLPSKADPRAPGVPGSLQTESCPAFTFDKSTNVRQRGSWDL